MATAFTTKERTVIAQSLMDAALKYAASIGMKHTSVDALCKDAGISKGAFYSFYESKELLFLAMFERMHQQMYGSAKKILEESSHLPSKEQAALAIQEMYHVFARHGLSTFMQEDLPLLLRKLPQSILGEHYHDDEQHIMELLNHSGIGLTTSLHNACTVFRLLILTPMLEREIGEGFSTALNLLIEGACNLLIA